MRTILESQTHLLDDLTADEHNALTQVEQALAEGLELYRWWQRMESDRKLKHIPLVRQLNSPDWNYGILADAPLRRGLMPVLGVIQGMFYDQPKVPASNERFNLDWYKDQVREFALRYFLRTTWAPLPERFPSMYQTHSCEIKPRNDGWAFQQVFYKLLDSGKIGRFPPGQRFRIVDLRRLFDKYEWVVLKVKIFSFALSKTFLNANGPRLTVPMPQHVWVVAHKDICRDLEAPKSGLLGEYGGGWAVIPDIGPDTVVTYGPRRLGTTFEFIHFQILENGQIWTKIGFLTARPNRVFHVDPVTWSLRLAELASFGALSSILKPIREKLEISLPIPSIDPMQMIITYLNILSGGVAKRELCLSRNQLYEDIMVTHFVSLFQLILGTLPTWGQVPNWLDKQNLPHWVNGFRANEKPSPLGSNDSVDTFVSETHAVDFPEKHQEPSSSWTQHRREEDFLPLDGRLLEPCVRRASVSRRGSH